MAWCWMQGTEGIGAINTVHIIRQIRAKPAVIDATAVHRTIGRLAHSTASRFRDPQEVRFRVNVLKQKSSIDCLEHGTAHGDCETCRGQPTNNHKLQLRPGCVAYRKHGSSKWHAKSQQRGGDLPEREMVHQDKTNGEATNRRPNNIGGVEITKSSSGMLVSLNRHVRDQRKRRTKKQRAYADQGQK